MVVNDLGNTPYNSVEAGAIVLENGGVIKEGGGWLGGISFEYCNKRNIKQNETNIKQGFKTHIGEVGK